MQQVNKDTESGERPVLFQIKYFINDLFHINDHGGVPL